MRIKRILFRFWKADSERKISKIKDHIDPRESILDIGAGPCWVTFLLREMGYSIIPVDITNQSIFDEIRPMIFNGRDLPYRERKFDVSLILTVLHHSNDPVLLLRESSRVSKKVIIIEDIYSSSFMEFITKFADSLMNLHFLGHPHENKTDAQWRNTFRDLDLQLEYSEIFRIGMIFKQVLYVLKEP